MNIKDNLVKWKRKSEFFPYKIEMHISSKCNLKCGYCGGGSSDIRTSELNREQLTSIVTQCLDMNAQEFHFTGPEPFMRAEELMSILRLIKKNERKTILATNAMLISAKNIKDLIEIGCDDIGISLDSHYPVVHNYLRGSSKAFWKVITNIQNINRYKLIKHTIFPRINIIVVITNINYNHLNDFVKYISTYNVNSIIFQPVMTISKNIDEFKLSKAEINEFMSYIHNINKLLKKKKINSNIDNLLYTHFELSADSFKLRKNIIKKKKGSSINKILCYDPWWSICILNNGIIGPCNYAAKVNNNKIMDNSIKDIWFGSFFESIRYKMENVKYPIFCRKCNLCAQNLIEKDNIMDEE